MGTPALALPPLPELVRLFDLPKDGAARAPAPGGRGLGLRPSPVQAAAERFGLPVRTPSTLRDAEAADALVRLEAEAVVVVAYGLILPGPVLAAPPLGCLNLHGSLLPRWRGAAPIQRAVMAGDAVSGVMVMRMEAGLDTGPVGMAETVPIGRDMTAGDLHDLLAPVGADLMGRAVAALGRGTLQFRAQAEAGVTYARKIEKAECRIDWTQPAAAVHNLIRGLSPFPGAFFEADLGGGTERVKVLRSRPADGSGPPGTLVGEPLTVACGSGALALVEVQRAGKGPLGAEIFRRGARIERGAALRPA